MNDRLISEMTIAIASNFGFKYPTSNRLDLSKFESGDSIILEEEVDGKVKKSSHFIISFQIQPIQLNIMGLELPDETIIVLQSKTAPPYAFTIDMMDGTAKHQIWNMDRWINSDVQTTALALYGSEEMRNRGLPFTIYKGKELYEYLKKL